MVAIVLKSGRNLPGGKPEFNLATGLSYSKSRAKVKEKLPKYLEKFCESRVWPQAVSCKSCCSLGLCCLTAAPVFFCVFAEGAPGRARPL